MDLFEELKPLIERQQEALNVWISLREEQSKWYTKNRGEIQKLFPSKNKIYEIIDLPNAFPPDDSGWYWRQFKEETNYTDDDVFYFKPTSVRFNKQDIGPNGIPSVRGNILYSNLKRAPSIVNVHAYSEGNAKIYITHLKDVCPGQMFVSFKPTKIYIMIDKNTGYYKIGRSINPKFREKTLQSEKPTIEILHVFDGIWSNETELHQMFQSKKIRGEWYDLSGSDIEIIKKYFDRTEERIAV